MNKSDEMRRLYDEGLNVSEISKRLGCNYSYVYGVIKRYVGEEVRVNKDRNEESKAEKMKRLWDEGKSIGEISRELNSNYSYCWIVIDNYRKSKEKK